MTEPTLDYSMLNEYTLVETLTESGIDKGMDSSSRNIQRHFNFMAQRVTTMVRDANRYYNHSSGVGVGLQTHYREEDFTSLPTSAELELMHAKLVELGGTPPALSDCIPAKRTQPLSVGAKNGR